MPTTHCRALRLAPACASAFSITQPQGSLNVVLHAHIPWVKRAGRWPFGEEWLFQAILETYLPLLALLERLRVRGIRRALTVGVTPVLIEMLHDVYLTHAFEKYLASRVALLEMDIKSSGDKDLRSLAERAREEVLSTREAWRTVYQRDILAPLREAARRGDIEIVTSAATHAYLPLLGESSLEVQLRTGIATTQSAFDVVPSGIWLPECGYAPHMLPALERCGLKFFYTDARAIRDYGALPFGALAIPESSLAFYARDSLANELVDSESAGYPGGAWYLEFHKRHERSGQRYWRVTDRTGELDGKQLYEPLRARESALGDARSFAQTVAERVRDGPVPHPHMTLTFDAELFGHWWFEGFTWLEEMLVQTAANGLGFCTPSRQLERDGVAGSFGLGASSWGIGGDDRVWANTDTADLWVELQRMESQLEQGARSAGLQSSRAIAAARELLLAQSSDWPFQITNTGAAAYGRERFGEHRRRFASALAASEGLAYDAAALAEARESDTCFPQIDLTPFACGASV